MGLGLPLAKGIIELHNGSIQVDSGGSDRGTAFTIELHLAKSEDLTAISSAENVKSRSTTIDDESSQSLSDRERILIIEDDTDSAYLLQMFLEKRGYRVKLAFNGIDGIELARQFAPDIILSDISLGEEIDGYTLASTIRNDPQLNSIYLIAMSGYGQAEDKKKAKAAGFDLHLTKPLDLEQIESAIAQKI